MSTVVAVHAHPDDESLLTGGTLADLAAQGHRVVLVVATSGEHGRSADTDGLGDRRSLELRNAARILGCERVVELGYADSGWDIAPATGGRVFADVPVEEVAGRIAEVLREEAADVAIGYDEHGGYGHLDHVHVHHAVVRAVELAGTRRLLYATVDRTSIRRVVRLLGALHLLPVGFDPDRVATWFTAREAVTHRVRVRHLRRKRRALRAHRSQTEDGLRTVTLLARLPLPAFAVVAGREWFVERDLDTP